MPPLPRHPLYTAFRRALSLTVAGLTVLAAGPAWAQDDPAWEGYYGQLRQRRQAEQDAYRQWVTSRRDAYGQWQLPRGQQPDTAAGTAYELSDPDFPGGSYDVRLPSGGSVRLNLTAPEGATAGAWGEREYRTAGQYADRLGRALRDVHARLYRDRSPLTKTVAQVRNAAATLEQRLERRDDPQLVLREFAALDEQWQRVSYGLRQQLAQDATLAEAVARADQAEEALNRSLAFAPGPLYDRPLVLGLARRLEAAMADLATQVEQGQFKRNALAPLVQQLGRAQRQARDFALAVEQNASLAEVVAEYQEFDRQWHRLADGTRGEPGVVMRAAERQVYQLDQALHRELRIEPPVYGPQERSGHLAERVSRSAEHLVRELRQSLDPGQQEALYAAEAFADSASRMAEALSGRHSPEAALKSLQEATLTWRALDQQLDAAAWRGDEHARGVIARLREDVDRLTAEVNRPQ